ncbi:MAG TPA: S8 family serine peptidase [Thermoanaerobaculia bacterium]|jgi:subtilisin family serine protease|nr:S8 family serine peptidase [Thermoanaerobaculia bacterium]
MKPIIAFVLTVAAAATAWAAPTRRYIVLTRHTPRLSEQRLFRDVDASAERAVRPFRNAQAFAADLTAEQVAELRASGEVRSITPVVERSLNDLAAAPHENYTLGQTVPYGIDLVHARDLWPVTKGEGNVNVAIVDTGIDFDHADLKANYAGGWNTYTLTDEPRDDHRHGTHVAGTIGAVENTIGVVGVAPRVRIWSVKVLDSKGVGTDEHIAAGVDWVIDKAKTEGGHWIMSLSLGAPDPSPIETELFAKAIEQGILIVAAAGNRGFPEIDYPALYPGVMAIGAVDADKKRARFSSWGVKLSVMAPGVSVLSTLPTGTAQVADVQADDGTLFTGSPIAGSPKASIFGRVVDCKLGRPGEFPAEASGNIALIRRGEITFNEKARNAKAAGAAAVLIYNNPGGIENEANWSLILTECDDVNPCHDREEDVSFAWPLAIGLNTSEGLRLLDKSKSGSFAASYRLDDYGMLSGTSMATPHVAGTAALLWSLAPDATAEQIKLAIQNNAADLDQPGFDAFSGFGLLDALAAAKALAPQKFGLEALPAFPVPPTVRRPR